MRAQNYQQSIWFLPLLSGLFIGTTYIPFPPWASLFCFVPLWLFWSQQQSLKKVLLGGWLCSIVFTLIGFNWVTYVLHEFAHLNWFFCLLGMLLFACVAHLFVPVAGLFWFLIKQKLAMSATMSLLMMALITILCEAYSWTLFDWNFGYTWFGYGIPIYQLAEFIGFSGLSALTLLFNLPLLVAWKLRKQRSGAVILALTVSGFLLLNGFGLYTEHRLAEPDESFTALLVQGNIGNEQKLAAELGRGYRDEIIRQYFHLTDIGLNNENDIDFVVWPEVAFPSLLGQNVKYNQHPQRLAQYVRNNNVPLITGAFSADTKTRLIGNSLFILDTNGITLTDFYTKSILLAFGEYIPGESLFPQLRQWLPAIGQFKRGPGPLVISLGDYEVGAQICYEGLFPAYSKQLADQGAQFIVNLTNDSWYGSWQEPFQHFYMTLARAVEFRRPVIRATNTGISSVALANGKILDRSPLHEPWSGVYHVAYLENPTPTFYQNWFGLLPAFLWSSWLILIVIGWWQKNISDRKNNRTPL